MNPNLSSLFTTKNIIICVIVTVIALALVYSLGGLFFLNEEDEDVIDLGVELPKLEEEGDCLCSWKFKGYRPSAFETMWLENAPAWKSNICPTLVTQKSEVDYWVANIGKNHSAGDDASRKVFSSFYYRDCNKQAREIFIEPLGGVMRHPLVCWDTGRYLVDKSYMEIDCEQVRSVVNTGGKVWMFDLGASTWGEGPGGPSQAYFYGEFNRCGVNVSGWYMWEAGYIDPVGVYAQVPDQVKPYYHWMNVPCNDGADNNNPLNIIRTVVKPSDYLTIKLDIDHNELETKLVIQMIEQPDLHELIDEFFFEHHVNLEPLASCCWGTKESEITLVDSIEMFYKLRKLGIKAHSWV